MTGCAMRIRRALLIDPALKGNSASRMTIVRATIARP